MTNQVRLRKLFVLTLLLGFCGVTAPANGQPLKVVPVPQSLSVNTNAIGFQGQDQILFHVKTDNKAAQTHLAAIAGPFSRLTGLGLRAAEDQAEANLLIKLDETLPAESYRLAIKNGRISITFADSKGLAHSTATLLQIFGQFDTAPISEIEISQDKPNCRYRSFMIDLGRNPHSLGALKETIDLLWFYKLDSLHLHLTDDQRFAFPSKAFPKLASMGGKISWEEFQSLEQYANAKGITLIPELDVPGHSTILRREYPEVFGKSPTELAERKSSREGIKTLLDEMIELFPSSPYVHIGGDEAYGVDENLQRDFINDLHQHLQSKGKKTVVWEGPSQGQGEYAVATDVIHINWRTINFPADKMLSAGHPVVNAAWDPLYLVDHYPRNNFTMASPEHIYQTMNLNRFAHFNPGIPTFSKPIVVEPNDNLIGFCMPWWEGREVNYFPLIVPRVVPMAEVSWNSTMQRDYDDFSRRAKIAESTRIRAFYPATISSNELVLPSESVFHNTTTVTIESALQGEIRYTTDGTRPHNASKKYESPIELNATSTIRAATFVTGNQIGHGSRRTFVHVTPVENLALGKPVTSSATSGPLHTPARLTDGGTGNLDYYLGYPAEPEPIELIIDLQKPTTFNRIVTHTAFNGNSYESYVIEVSKDGKSFTEVANRKDKPEKLAAMATHRFELLDAQFIRIKTNGCKNMVFDAFSKFTEVQVFRD